MSRQNRSPWIVTLVMMLAVSLPMAVPALAEDPPEQPPEDPEKAEGAETPGSEAPVLGSKTSTTKGSSLADVAGRIRLNKPAADGSGVVISNDNLSKVSSKGKISVAGSSTPASSAAGSGEPASTAGAGAAASADADAAKSPANELITRYFDQKNKVDTLQFRLDDIDRQLAQPSPDPHYQYEHNSPQNRAPGVQDQGAVQREEVAKELAAERAKLEAIRREAQQKGIPLEEPKK
jgi:hypothetical protein